MAIDAPNGERRIAGLALIAAPALLLAGTLIHRAHVSGEAWLGSVEAGRTRFYVAHLLFVICLALLVPAVLGVAELVGDRELRLARLGRSFALLGLLGAGIVTGTDFFLWQLAESPSDHQAALVAVERLETSVGAFGPAFLLAAGVPIGFGLLALGIDRGAIASRWSAVAIAVAGPVALLGFTLGWVAIAAAAIFLAGAGSLGLALIGGRQQTAPEGAR